MAKKFETFMSIGSILGFLAIFLNSFFGINISPWVTSLLFIIIGVGLVIVGNILNLGKMLRGGLNNPEIAFVLTGTVGLLSLIAGIISLPIGFFSSLQTPAIDGIKGVVAFFAIVLIIIQTWLVR